MKRLIAIAAACAALCFSASAQEDDYKAPAEQDVRDNLAAWQDLKFGMFIHWGTYSIKGIVESWSLCPGDEDWKGRPKDQSYYEYLEEYEGLQRLFNPVQFDPAKWAEAAKYAGMKYLVFTTKHHDGFNMFDTAQSDYKITSSKCPFSSDPRANIAKEIFNAYRAEGFMIGAYYSIVDWHNQDFWWNYQPPKDNFMNYDPAKHPDKWQRFQDFVVAQIGELTGGEYGKVDMLWFDQTNPSGEYDVEAPWERMANVARGNQPGMLMVARHQGNIYENYLTPEQEIPEEDLGHPWESCITMGSGWSWRYKPDYKSTRELLTMLVKVVSRGGNLLLNVGPSPQGTLDDDAYERLHDIGDWMKVNSEGIYSSKPYKLGGNLMGTTVDGNIYAYYVPSENDAEELPAQVFVPNVNTTKVCLLGAEKTHLKCVATEGGVTVTIPEKLRHNLPCSHIWCLKFAK